MSRYEWEEGTIKLPRESYSLVRTAVIKTYNRHQDSKFKKALIAYKAASEAGFRKRGFNRANWVSTNQSHYAVAHYITKTGSDKVFMPKKKDFKHLPVSRTAVLTVGDGVQITFNNKTNAVFYFVNENNHACEDARRHPVVVSLFQQLHRIHHWTRGSGGEIVGNDEYNRDNRDFDGGSNYVIDRFGPKEKGRKFNGMFFTDNGRQF